MSRRRLTPAAICFAMLTVSLAGIPLLSCTEQLERQLFEEYAGKILTFRVPYCESELHFDVKGKPIGFETCGGWLTDQQISIRTVRLTDYRLQVSSRRVLLSYDESS